MSYDIVIIHGVKDSDTLPYCIEYIKKKRESNTKKAKKEYPNDNKMFIIKEELKTKKPKKTKKDDSELSQIDKDIRKLRSDSMKEVQSKIKELKEKYKK
jgi:hypothetical protein